tara:strand:+ start:24335 stop:25438 length:1104 start_codon:yes stop_codon:yes gene_type:complete
MDTNEFFAPARTTSDEGSSSENATDTETHDGAFDTAATEASVAKVPGVSNVSGDEATTTPSSKPPQSKAPRTPVWVDLLSPTNEEIQDIEKRFGIEVPTREEMQEIELSSRLYDEDGALFMTVSVLNRAASDAPQTAVVTFILVKKTLITLRYADPVPFKTFIRRVNRSPSLASSADAVLFGLLEQIVDRLADVMEQTATDLEGLSNQVFASPEDRKSDQGHQDTLRQIGRAGNLSGKAKDSLLNLHRLGLFLSTQTRLKKDAKARLKIISRDIVSITEHANFIANKVTFLLDATLGMISLEQNNIIKIFSVAAAAFLPPTLIASIYGMNFEVMPELDWQFGYPVAIGLMVLSAVLPLWYFKRKGWL